jgi:hypothetical protein
LKTPDRRGLKVRAFFFPLPFNDLRDADHAYRAARKGCPYLTQPNADDFMWNWSVPNCFQMQIPNRPLARVLTHYTLKP